MKNVGGPARCGWSGIRILAAAGLLCCGLVARVQSAPVIGNLHPDGTQQFQPASALTCQVTSATGVDPTGISVQVTATPLLGPAFQITYTTANGLLVSGTATSRSVTAPLLSNTVYAVTITATDTGGALAQRTVAFDTISPAYLFEAEDYDHDGGLYIENPQTNAYRNLNATEGVDTHAGNFGNGQAAYRPSGLNTENCGDTPRAPYRGTGQQDYDVGWNDGGNWGNYTRTFPAGTYNIFMRGSDGNSSVADSAGLSLVTAGRGTTQQTTVKLGTFSVPALGGWQTYGWVPLLSTNGNLATFTGGGVKTLRVITDNGNYNANCYLLLPADLSLPVITNVYPDGAAFFQLTNRLSFTVTSAAGVAASNIMVTLDGTNMAAALDINGNATAWQVGCPLSLNTAHTVTITVTANNGQSASHNVAFNDFEPNIYQWEAEDYDYTSNGVAGLYFDNPQTNAYAGLASTPDVDNHQSDPGANPFQYRPNSPAPSTTPSGDLTRPQFAGATDYNIGFFGGGSWCNYTRHYPSGTYEVWGRFAEGATPTEATLAQVVSGAGTASQTANMLGLFHVPVTGWQTWAWAPLQDDAGQPLKVRFDGSPATLQLGGSPVGGHPEVNVNFLMLVPVPPDPFVVTQTVNDGPTNVIIRFSKPVENASATNVANYVFAANGTVLSATLAADNETVTLTTTPLLYGTNYAIIINQVRDRMNLPNIIAADTRAEFPALPFTLQDLGNPPGTVAGISTDGGVNLTAPGGSFGGTNDQGGFASQSYSGNFDVAVRLAGLDLTDIFAQAGLMARDNLNPGARFVAAFATPAMNGSGFEWRSIVGGPTQQTGNFPANYPQTWLRLRRVGNVFTGYAGYDGQVWTMLGSNVINFPTQLYVGLAVSSHNSEVPATAAFRDFTAVTNAVVATMANPHEPPGASSRKTPLIFSEIMYKPAARTDGANTEFIELYNSNPWFQDISGYQIVCADLQYTFPPHTQIPGGGVIVVAAAPEAIRSVYGLTNNVYGPYTGSLKKSEELQLRDEQGAVLLTVPFTATAPWPVAASGTGHSIVLTHPSYGEGDPRAWERSELAGGSPGQLEAWYPSPLHQVVINEWLVPTNSGTPGFVELYNHSATPVDVSGCVLTADSTTNQFGLPPGTAIPAGGFVSFDTAELGFEPAVTGDTLMLESADQTRIFDAVALGPQQCGVAMGRAPDGAGEFYRLQTATPGSTNDVIRVSDVVINELMYDPISHNDDDQYVELYNRSTNTVDLSGWQLAGGVAYTMPAGTSLAPDAYLVVARNRTNLFGKYPQLNAGNTVGDFSGKLAHKGEYLALTMPVPEVITNGAVLVTNTLRVVVNDLTYGTGGRWGEWSAGGGSSLELINPLANGRLAASWADSDETQKADWTNIEFTGVLDLGQNYEAGIAHAQLGLLDEGECLVDDVEVDSGSDNLVSNPSFESGATGWSFQGCMSRSSVEAGGYNNDGHALHVRASDTIWTGDNSCQVTLSNTNLQAGQTVTLRFKARWLCGWPEALLRLNGNWLEAAGSLPVPGNLGTPGLPNSRYVTHPGVALSEVTHTPALPAANQPVVITARAYDPEGSPNLKLFYRLGPATSQVILPMHDDGLGGDAVAGDGVYSVTIPGMSAGQLVAFHIDASDNFSTVTRFPALVADHAPLRECLMLFGDDPAGGSFSVYHLWVSNTNATRWANLGNLSNESHDGTMVYGNRVIYNMQGRFAGSPYHQNYGRPDAQLCNYKWAFPADDKFLGATSFNKIHQPGNGAGDDGSLQREQLANTFLRTLGVPWLNRRYVAVYVNGNRRGTLMEDAQTPGSDVVAKHFPDDADGWLYKMQPWFEFAPALSGTSMDFNNVSWATLNNYTTTGGIKKTARYRYQYLIRTFPGSASDFHKVYELVDAASTYNTPGFASNLTAVADMENWMRVFAANHAAGNWDSFGAQNAQNLYGYAGALGTKYSLLMFDFNIVIGNQNSSWGPGENLFAVNSADPALQTVFNTPVFRRMYWRALGELVNGPLNPTNSSPLLDAKYQVFAANGLSVEDPNTAIKPWLAQAKSSIAAQLAAENTLTFAVNPAGLSNTVAVLSGTAPVAAQVIQINGAAAPVTWTSVTRWSVTLPLQHGTNVFTVMGLDHLGNLIPGEIGSTSLYYAGTGETPPGPPVVFINEWMADNGKTLADPAGGGFADWFELYNPGTNMVDLGGCFLTDKLTDKFQFQVPTNGQYQLPPQGFLLVWADNQPEQNLPGQPDLHVNFALSKSGEAIGLFTSDGTAIDTVTFGAQTTDVASGRIPDGGLLIGPLTVPTPGTNNFSQLPLGLVAGNHGDAQFLLSWQTIAGQSYQVEYTDELTPANWLPLGGAIHGTGGMVTVTNAVAGPAQRFYRIQIR